MMAELTHKCAVLSQQHQVLFTGVHGCLDKEHVGTCILPLLSVEILFWRSELPLYVLKHHRCVCDITCTKFL